jgi:hypothetical protein
MVVVVFVKILIPLLSGRENDKIFVDSIGKEVKEIVILQIVDKQFLPKAGSAMAEVRQFRIVADSLKKAIGAKKKKFVEMTEWGITIPKIISTAIFQKVDYVLLVKQSNQFFDEVTSALKKNKINFELVELPVIEPVKKKFF